MLKTALCGHGWQWNPALICIWMSFRGLHIAPIISSTALGAKNNFTTRPDQARELLVVCRRSCVVYHMPNYAVEMLVLVGKHKYTGSGQQQRFDHALLTSSTGSRCAPGTTIVSFLLTSVGSHLIYSLLGGSYHRHTKWETILRGVHANVSYCTACSLYFEWRFSCLSYGCIRLWVALF